MSDAKIEPVRDDWYLERRAEQEKRIRETRALRLLADGTPAKEVSRVTGCTLEEVTQLARDFPFTPTNRCPEQGCGQHRSSPGRPRDGWVQIKETGQNSLWFCGWDHAHRHTRTRINP